MGKIESTLRGEIARLARKEIGSAVGPLTRQLVELKKQVRTLKKAAAAGKPVAAVKPPKLELPADKELVGVRIGPRWIKALRKRLGLSQGKLADIVGVSLSAVGSWEYGRAKPAGKNKATLVALRKLNKKGLRAMLGGGGSKAPAKPKMPAKKKSAKRKSAKRGLRHRDLRHAHPVLEDETQAARRLRAGCAGREGPAPAASEPDRDR